MTGSALTLRHALRQFLVALVASWALACGSASAAPESAWSRNDHAALRLVSATTAVGTAESLRLGLQFQLAPGWKVYWRSPGDAGFPPKINWDGSDNFAAAMLRWPAPMRFELFGLDTFGYEGEVILPIDLKPAHAGEAVRLDARVDYLVCKEICVPYQADLALALPAGPALPSEHAHAIDRFNVRVPGDGSRVGLAIDSAEWRGGASPLLSVRAHSMTPFAAPDVFVEGPPGWSFGKPTPSFSDGGRAVVLRVPAHGTGAGGDGLVGQSVTLTLVDGERAAERAMTIAAGATSGNDLAAFAGMVALAVLGGLILNLMPCVLPVLSLKLLNFVTHADAARATIRRNFLASAAGIVASFLLLAGGLIVLKSSGHIIGWGIQFQQPAFLIFMTLLLVVFAANLWGWFEFRLPSAVSEAAGRATSNDDHLLGAFVTGAFATLLATPCSAPFLGTAVGFALASGPVNILAIFLALGLGMALPYLAVAAFPTVARAMPRPGRWMLTLRRVLGIALLGTVVWLLSVLAAQIGMTGIAALAVLLILLLGFLWVMREAGLQRRWLRLAGFAAFAVLAFLVPPRFSVAPAEAPAAAAEGWRPWEPGEVERLVAAGHVVFVDVTADWCITCQVNKSLVLTRGEVAARLAGKGPGGERIVAMRADWTRPDPRIAAYLASFGRYGIPFNAVYGPAAPSGIALPELLTADVVLAALDRAGGPNETAAAPAPR